MTTGAPALERTRRDSYAIIVMAASAGGIDAVSDVLSRLPVDFAVPIIVVLHHAPGRSAMLIRILARKTQLRVMEATDGDHPTAGCVYVAPWDRHVWLTPDYAFASQDGTKINFLRSSSEPLLSSVVSLFGSRAIAVVLSGSGKNGAVGAKALHDAGGMVLAQDRASSLHFGMPGAAIAAGAVNQVLPLQSIGPALLDLTQSDRARSAATPASRPSAVSVGEVKNAN